MTCEELRNFLHDGAQAEGEGLRPSELAQHLGVCTECSRLWVAREELRTGLDAVRESAPAVSASLDRAVMANFRRYSARSPVSSKRSARVLPVFRWAAAAAAVLALVFAARVFFSARGHQPRTAADNVAQMQPLLPRATNRNAPISPAAIPAAAQKSRRPNRLHNQRDRTVANHAESTSVQAATPTAGFRSLMYCDPLSCAGAMEVIRVQLPSPALGLEPVTGRQSGPVYADVLVGADGVARGIRVVQ